MNILKFHPHYVEKPWGGDKISTVRSDVPDGMSKVGECWCISAVPGAVTTVANGMHAGTGLDIMCLRYGERLLGFHVMRKFGCVFPMLVKLIDAHDNLSVQVHPNDEQARANSTSECSQYIFGKTEMWYVMGCARGAEIINGFERELPAAEYEDRVRDGSLLAYLHHQPVKPHEVYYLPAGRVHAIGRHVFVAEIQQSSDITYRIFDYGRSRELHTRQAGQVADFGAVSDLRSRYKAFRNRSVPVVESSCFNTSVINMDGEVRLPLGYLDSFSVLMCVDGSVRVESSMGDAVELAYGECCLVPATVASVTLRPVDKRGRVLHTYMP